ncbi:RNA-directed DNA polymerase [Roseibium sp. TrichSKD4]|nr:RNA-directed DNA polymerase [Roseibium sp. TrichSKD4]
MRPFGGVRPAIKLVMDAMAKGGDYYYQSDIKAFFTKIPTAGIVAKVQSETHDEKLAALFEKGLEVNLANKDELLSYAKLFPSNGTGVAQGSSLSAFAGNVLLFDFDHQLNDMGVTAVRYIDDLLIVSGSERLLDQAIVFSEKHLSSFGFSLYPAVAGSDKAARGECKTGFNFLGCTVQTNRCVPSSASRVKTH